MPNYQLTCLKQLTGYDPVALDLMHNALGGVYRYIGIPYVPVDKRESVRNHVESIGQRGSAIIKMAGQQLGHHHEKALFAFAVSFTQKYMVHDNGEIIVEPMTAMGETDSVFQNKLAAYPMAEMEAKIGAHFYQYALSCPDDFNNYVAQARATCVPASHATGAMDKNPADVLAFYQNIEDLFEQTAYDMRHHKKWHSPQVQAQVSFATAHYRDIEEKRTFAGTFGKILEKLDGSAYIMPIIKASEQGVYEEPHENRMIGRYEGNFCLLLEQAGDDIVYQTLAKHLIHYSYARTIEKLELLASPIQFNDKSISLQPSQALDIYRQEAARLQSMPHELLAPDNFQHGKTLLDRAVATYAR